MPQTAAQAVYLSVLQAKYDAEQERMDEAQEKLDLYRDDYEAIIKEKMKELFHPDNYDRLSYHVNQSQNILKRVVNQISMVYKAEAKRSIGKGGESNPSMNRFAAILEENNWDVKAKKVNRYSNLLNECLVKVGVRGGKIVYDIITPNICGVIQNQDDPTKADALFYSVDLSNTLGVTGTEWYYYDVDGDAAVFDGNFRIVRQIYTAADNPMRDPETGEFFLPFAVCHREEPDNAFFDQDTGRDLFNASVLMGVKMTLFDYYMKTCSFKQIYILGTADLNIPNKQKMDPMTILTAQHGGEGEAKIGTLDLQINMDQFINALNFQTNSIITTYGLAPDDWTMSASETSGRALKIKNRALLEYRSDQLPMFRQFESDLFRLTRMVNNAFAGSPEVKWKAAEKIDDSAELDIDFGEIGFEEDDGYELALESKRLSAGLVSPGQFYQRFNPDIKDEKEAEGKLIQNLEKMTKLRDQHPALDEMLNRIFKERSGFEGGGGFGGDDQSGENGDAAGRSLDRKLDRLGR